jgi:hypothetical protein
LKHSLLVRRVCWGGHQLLDLLVPISVRRHDVVVRIILGVGTHLGGKRGVESFSCSGINIGATGEAQQADGEAEQDGLAIGFGIDMDWILHGSCVPAEQLGE